MVASLDTLPTELYYAIINHIEPDDLRHSLLALTRAAPRSSVPVRPLFQRIRLTHQSQVFQLYLRLTKSPEYIELVQHFSYESWTVDPDILINLLALLPRLRSIWLFVGPTFSPDHLEELFSSPREDLELLSLRFRPYVETANYHPFLAGLYFDSTIRAFSRWPEGCLTTLSIIQDPLDHSAASANFAQPIVFFHLDALSNLARAPIADNLLHFRLRIPSRQTAPHLYAKHGSLTGTEFLDLSTSVILEGYLERIIGRFPYLKTLVLDHCAIVSQRADPQGEAEAFGQWSALGRMLALAGDKCARERERKLKRWLEAVHAANTDDGAPAQQPPPRPKRPKKGRKGLATATMSLRDSPPKPSVPLLADVASTSQPAGRPLPRPGRIRILPALPPLASLATTPQTSVPRDQHATVRAEFAKGWAAGVTLLLGIRARLRQSWGNGLRVVQFDADYLPESVGGDGGESESEVGLEGLRDVTDKSEFALGEDGEGKEAMRASPILCLAGPGRDGDHVEGCAHQLGWEIWQDDL